MLLLGLDTSTPATTVAVLDGPRVLASGTAVDARRHGELLAPLIAATLRDAGARPGDLTAVAAGVGPGPFTGLRIGLVTAAALGDAIGIPTYGVGSLDALAGAHPGPLTVVTDARRREVYWASYDPGGTRVAGPAVDLPRVLAGRLPSGERLAGAGARLYEGDFAGFPVIPDSDYPAAAMVARLALPRAESGCPTEPLTPLYLRRPDATPPGPPKAVLRR
ncbi:MAG TPA: tRNA (adenosine(37)-N6)-threonylcarbamoyltransferase complex dimerization subunit type 1 TsaB [Mycobacteriales bacterium]|nr:tRNA (adenosine(37)-N6)-threonylcarbamoyltransferase complex dimerization subunit type 1 TsaB [Mycobacteriales bacterium]